MLVLAIGPCLALQGHIAAVSVVMLRYWRFEVTAAAVCNPLACKRNKLKTLCQGIVDAPVAVAVSNVLINKPSSNFHSESVGVKYKRP